MVGKPLRERITFVAEAENAMASARRDEDSGAGGLGRIGKIRRDRRAVYAGDVVTAALAVDDFRFIGESPGSRSPVGPEENFGRDFRGVKGECAEKGDESERDFHDP